MKGWCECIKATKEEEEAKREMARCGDRQRGRKGKMNNIEVFYKKRWGFCWCQCELHVGATSDRRI